MIRYEQRVSPGKLDVWAVEDWPEWNAPVGRTARKAVTYEEYVLFDGCLRIHAEGQAPIELRGGDWFALEPGAVCEIEVLEPVSGFRQTSALG